MPARLTPLAPFALALATSLALTLAGCGGGGADATHDGGPITDPAPEITQLSITPPDPTLIVVNNQSKTVRFRAYGLTPAGDTVDVTAWTRFSSQDPSLLSIEPSGTDGGTGVTSTQLAGIATIRGTLEALTATTTARVIQRREVVEADAPADAPALFEAAGLDPTPARAPAVMYPSAGTILPPNYPGLEIHFLAGAGNDVFEVGMSAGLYEYRRYATCTRTGAGCRVVPTTEDWAAFGPRFAGQDVAVAVAGLTQATPELKGVSSDRVLEFAIEELDAALYYWAATDGRLYRVDFGRAGAGAELFYSGGDCVGCHALSRDGTRAAIGIGSPSPSGLDLVDVATGDLLWAGAVGSVTGSNYQTFSPDASKVLTTDGFSMRLRDAATGADLGGSIQSGALFPDWSADGSQIVFAQKNVTCPSSPCGDFTLGAGSIVTRPTTDGLTFGAAQNLVPYDGGHNNYYPAFTPDSAWIVFNRVATGAGGGMDSYDNRDASLWMVPADGGTPVRLSQADGGYRGNSWPKVAPKLLATSRGYVTFVTFSSRRPIGLRPSTETAQIWMAAFDPARAGEGLDPSAAAVHVPWQDQASGNHIAQWATEIPRQPCGPDMTCPGGEICEGGQCVPQID